MEKDQYKKLISSVAAAYQDATEQFIGDSEDLLKSASKAKAGIMQTQISVDDMNQYYADALLDCLKNSNKLINSISEKFFKNNYKEALTALTEIINNESAAMKAKLKGYGLENDKEVKTDFLTVNYVTKYLKPLVTGKDLINLIRQKEKDGVRTRATVALTALKNISDLYFNANMSGLKRSIVDLDKISKMKNESTKITKTKTLLEQAKEILLGKSLNEEYGKNINLAHKDLTKLPNDLPDKVEGFFDCANNNLIDLAGAPTEVKEFFECSNNKLPNLKGAPKEVGDFYCSTNRLTSLEGASDTVVARNFVCSNNRLTDLKGAPTEKVGGNFDCSHNRLTSLWPEGASDIEIGGRFDCSENRLTDLKGAPKKVGGDFWCRNNKVKFTEEQVRAVCEVKGKVYV